MGDLRRCPARSSLRPLLGNRNGHRRCSSVVANLFFMACLSAAEARPLRGSAVSRQMSGSEGGRYTFHGHGMGVAAFGGFGRETESAGPTWRRQKKAQTGRGGIVVEAKAKKPRGKTKPEADPGYSPTGIDGGRGGGGGPMATPFLHSVVRSAELSVPKECYRTLQGKEGKPSMREIAYNDYGKRQEIPSPGEVSMSDMLKSVNKIPQCTLITKKCMTGDGKFGSTKWALKGMRTKSKKDIPELTPGSWGTCAVVGSSEALLKYQWGKDIDAHQTIIRYNAPVRKYTKHVGSRTDVILWKDHYNRIGLDEQEMHRPKWYIMNTMQARKDAPNMVKGDVPVVLHRMGNEQVLGKVLSAYAKGAPDDPGGAGYKKGGGGRKEQLVPTTGFRRVMAILSSGLCRRADLYGFSSGGGKYFSKDREPYWWHVLPAEHLMYRLLMQQGRLCIYGD